VGTAVGNDRLLSELRRVLLDATAVTLEEGMLALTKVGGSQEK
jgi:hypothetical protein